MSGSALAVQWAAHLISTATSSGSDPLTMNVERAVLVVGLEQPVEPEQGREQRGDPQDRRAEPRQQIEVGPERERHDRDQDEEEHRADRARRRRSAARCATRGRRGRGRGSCGASPHPAAHVARPPSPASGRRVTRPPLPLAGEGWGEGKSIFTSRAPPHRPQPQLLRALEPERRVGCGDDDAAAAQVRPHDGGEARPGRRRRARSPARRAATAGDRR